jgi:hypothetical protein
MPKPIEIDGQTFEVRVTDDGAFRANLQGGEVGADTYNELREKLTRLSRKAKVRLDLPITLLGVTQKPDPSKTTRHSWEKTQVLREAADTVDATVTGLHAQNQDVMLVLADSTKYRHSGHSYSRDGLIARRLTADERATYVRLATAAAEATAAAAAFVDSVAVGNARDWIEDQVAAAQKAAVDQEPATVEPTGDPRLDVPKRGYAQNDGKLATRTTAR